MNKYRFYKNEVEWFVDLPEYLEKGGSIGNLEMIEGADTMLDIMAKGKKEVILYFSTERFENSDHLTLKEKCEPLKGGAYYFMKEFEGKKIDLTMWLSGSRICIWRYSNKYFCTKRVKNLRIGLNE